MSSHYAVHLKLLQNCMSIILVNLKKKKKSRLVSCPSSISFGQFDQMYRPYGFSPIKITENLILCDWKKYVKARTFSIKYFKLKKKTLAVFLCGLFSSNSIFILTVFWWSLISCLCVMTLERTCVLGFKDARVQETQPHQWAAGLPAPLCYWPHPPSTRCERSGPLYLKMWAIPKLQMLNFSKSKLPCWVSSLRGKKRHPLPLLLCSDWTVMIRVLTGPQLVFSECLRAPRCSRPPRCGWLLAQEEDVEMWGQCSP